MSQDVGRLRKLAAVIVGAIILVVLATAVLARPSRADARRSFRRRSARQGSGEASFLSDAIPSALSTHLTGVPGIETKAPPTSTEFAEVGGDFRRVSLAYAVNLVVVPELKATAASFDLGLQAIDPVTRNVLWNDSFKGTRGECRRLRKTATSTGSDAAPSSKPYLLCKG